MGKDKCKGRGNERHIRLYSDLTNSPAWRDLSGNAVKALIYVASWENGRNNGELFISERSLAEAVNISRRTAHKVFDELEEHGFIAPTAKGYFTVKRGPATCWRLTWLNCPSAHMRPTNEFRSWKPQKKSRVQDLPATDANVAPASTVRRSTDEDFAPVQQISAGRVDAKNTPHSVAIGSLKISTEKEAPFYDAAVASIAETLSVSGQASGSPRRSCERCQREFAVGRHVTKRFCSETCRSAAERRRAAKRRAGLLTCQR